MLYSLEELNHPPSLADKMTVEEERLKRIEGVTFVRMLAKRMQMFNY
jgi:hypothetical protein